MPASSEFAPERTGLSTQDLPEIPAVQDLGEEVKREGNLSNRIAGRKRKADEADAPESSISMRINRRQSGLAAQAREQRKRIKEIIIDINGSSNQHSNSVEPANPLPRAIDQLSDPTFECTLPFPFVGSEAPFRFKFVKENWQYVGRTKFKELLQELKKVEESDRYSTLWLYGTQGYGKSHLLAALVCYLTARDERVVYISSCELLLEHPVEFLRATMLFAWGDDITTQKIITALDTLGEIWEFFKSKEKVIFVIDQMDALKIGWSGEKRKREDVSDWIRRFTSCHKTVYSFSTHNAGDKQAQNQTQTRMLPVYGGLTETEMDQWWKRHSDIDRGGYEKHDIEDATGRIPLLLDKCVVGKKIDLTVEALYDIYDKAVGFTQLVRESDAPSKWKWYYDYVTACFRHGAIPTGRDAHLDLIDDPYFYELDDNKGRYTCGLIRDAVRDELLAWNEDFADTDFLTSLPDFIDNKSIAGFMIEDAVLLSIRSNGLAINAEISGKAMEVRLLRCPSYINTNTTGTAVLYRPNKLKLKAIDGMIVLIKPGEKNTKEKLLLFPLQITLALADHANSREQFFKEYGWWIKYHSYFDVEIQFLWITPERRNTQEYPASLDPEWPKHVERYIPLQDVNRGIWEKYEDAQKSRKKQRFFNKSCSRKSCSKS